MPARPSVSYIEWIGTLFLRLLRMIIVPLIIASIVSGIASQTSARGLGRLGLKTLTYYLSTSLLAIIVGLFLVNVIQPGVGAELKLDERPEGLQSIDSVSDLVIEIVPRNVPDALVRGDMLQIIFFCLLVGMVILSMKDPRRQKRLADLFQDGFELMMKMTHWVILTAPLGVFAIVARVVKDQVGSIWDPEALSRFASLVGTMGSYMVTVAGGLVFHAVVTLPLILFLVARVSPRRQLRRPCRRPC